MKRNLVTMKSLLPLLFTLQISAQTIQDDVIYRFQESADREIIVEIRKDILSQTIVDNNQDIASISEISIHSPPIWPPHMQWFEIPTTMNLDETHKSVTCTLRAAYYHPYAPIDKLGTLYPSSPSLLWELAGKFVRISQCRHEDFPFDRELLYLYTEDMIEVSIRTS